MTLETSVGVERAPTCVNQGTSFHPEWLDDIRINKSAVERRVGTLGARRSVKKDSQIAFMLKAISCIDLTTLAGDDTVGRVKRLCAKARNPVQKSILKSFEMESLGLTTGAVCVYHEMVETAVKALEGTGVPVAAVSTGFPAGLAPIETRIEEIRKSVAAGAREIDIVITRSHVLTGNWHALYEEVKAFKEACGSAHMKAILATGEHGNLTQVAKASMTAMMAGADFIKTSTGMEGVNATLPVSLVMVRQIRDFYERTGIKVGYKPAGGIRKAKDAVTYLVLMKEELGRAWLEPELFRFGASGLLGDIERQLEYHAIGGYSASYRHPIG
ncbi:deoxyribose-phosphate aldolase [Kordiimonas sp. SCSIO 12610]|uniref:deoxyribose-phosphate aldolase n=1 Tax=Kordiimonas sp. SCSIO 12610 TaxID=2829597 RepID=UPI00210D0CFB|nr:deoxyribose-phosphate aldolase [Kordiimonas sp. SCSIO 12610]UTW54838.1 deoxyribose-phosphate aldolase [Kordiimonas sp. SCSIO 12610]